MISHACARCGAVIEGLAIGSLCPACARSALRRSAWLARWIAFGSTIAVAAYVAHLLPAVRPPLQGTARAVAAGAVVAWWWLTYRIAKEVALVCQR
ncbi:MAG TPA: hypothetical protein VN848_03015 [Gemmatimonadales bacterium]|nr:hypothetical protein [Gemmatimonadales bacterium]